MGFGAERILGGAWATLGVVSGVGCPGLGGRERNSTISLFSQHLVIGF